MPIPCVKPLLKTWAKAMPPGKGAAQPPVDAYHFLMKLSDDRAAEGITLND